MDRKLISKLLGISEKSFYRWKEERLIFKLLEKYFTDKELEEFLNTGKIKRFEIAQNNDYLLNKSIKLYKMVNFKLTPLARKFFFEELKNLKSYKIEDVSNIIFYSIKDEDLDSNRDYMNGISKISIRLDLLKLFEKIDDFELEYFIKNLEEIKTQSNDSKVSSNNRKQLELSIYGVDENNISEFEERFFKIEKNHFIKIKTTEENDNNQTSILFDLVIPLYNEKKLIKNFQIIEENNKLNLTMDEYDIFSNLIVKMADMKFF